MPGAGNRRSQMSAILFDKDQVDHLDDLSDRPGRLTGSKLLWVDLHEDRVRPEGVAEELDLGRNDSALPRHSE